MNSVYFENNLCTFWRGRQEFVWHVSY